MATDDSLVWFGRNVQKLIEGRDLDRETCYRMFTEMLTGRQPELHQGALLAALTAKGETAGEIAGAWQAIVDHDTETVDLDGDAPLVENSGTGMDRIKTFNVSTAAALIAAAGGVRLARHGARALTSSCGTVDLLEGLGVDVECGVDVVAGSVARAGIGLFNGMSARVHPNGLFRILGQIRFGSTLNIAASLASPCRPTHALRGVYSDGLIDPTAAVMEAIGYRRAMVVHGFDETREAGMDELSTVGESEVVEVFADGSRNRFSFAPEDVGLRRHRVEEIAALGDVPSECSRFLRIASGTGGTACEDTACLNAAAIFYVAGVCGDLAEGVEKSRGIVHSGRCLEKLAEWVQVQSGHGHDGPGRLAAAAERAGCRDRLREVGV